MDTSSTRPTPSTPSARRPTTGRGALIVLEGGDRCGKTTQVTLLTAALGPASARTLKFPDRTTPTGKIINTYLSTSAHIDDQLIHLLFAANRREHEHAMRDMLAQGTHLVVDRYAYSGVAFSAAKGLDLEWCMRPDVGLPEPDLVVYLDLSPEAAAKRGGYGEERYETREMQGKVRQLFLGKLKDDRYWKVVDAGKSVEEVHADIMALVEEVVKRVGGGHGEEQQVPPVRPLWEGKVERLALPPAQELVDKALAVTEAVEEEEQQQQQVAKCSE